MLERTSKLLTSKVGGNRVLQGAQRTTPLKIRNRPRLIFSAIVCSKLDLAMLYSSPLR